jgi:hypothetical protein
VYHVTHISHVLNIQESRERDCHDNAGQLLVEIIRVSRDSQITAPPAERFKNPLLDTAESVQTVQVILHF